MHPHASQKIFTAQAANGSSVLFSPSRNGNYDIQFKKTGTGTGALAFETNDLTDAEYQTDPTLGWVQHDMAAGTGVTSGKVDVPATNPWNQKVKLTNISARRCRWTLSGVAGSVSLDAWVSGN